MEDTVIPLQRLAKIGLTKRLSASMCEEFFRNFDPDIFEMEELHLFDVENEIKIEPKIVKRELCSINHHKSHPHRRERIKKFDEQYTHKPQCSSDIRAKLKERAQSRSPTATTPTLVSFATRSCISPFDSNYLNLPQESYTFSRSPSTSPSSTPALSVSPIESNFLQAPQSHYFSSRSPSISPSSSNGSVNNTFNNNNQNSNHFSFTNEFQHRSPMYENSEYIPNQWSYSNPNQQCYPPNPNQYYGHSF